MATPSERTIFFGALDVDDPAQRARFLDQACENNPALRANVDALLQANEQSDHIIDRPPIEVADTADLITSDNHWIDKQIGDYRLMEQIGEGGFGLVFVAQQSKPVRRQVALKVVKPGMSSKEVIARFAAEQQAVAMMDHPNIAQVFDAGVTEDGRPYFVMELVRGVPINQFCDAHCLTVEQRLKLFVDLCGAVHHAHQKAVIHRDIKPSNVLVTLHDDRPVVKVIDFGVAKAIGHSLTDQTIYTRFVAMIGTPLYMSPEQAEMSGLNVDTRSDIYSLGVMLYELLSGATPFERKRLDSAGLDELRRIIREEEPPRPSRRLTTMGVRATTVSASRQVEPARLSSKLRGDLDWIVMKSLEKNRDRRYDSAMSLAEDLQRYLRNEPVEARPPSTVYQFSKFARRHRVALTTATLVLLSLAGGLVASLWQMQRVARERDEKQALVREIEQFAAQVTRANELVAGGQSLAEADQLDAAEAAFGQAVTRQPSYYLPWVSRGQFFARQSIWNAAANDFAEALKLGAPTDSPPWWGVPALLELTNRDEASEQYFNQYRKRLSTMMLAGWVADEVGSSLEPPLPRELESGTTAKIRWEWIRNGLVKKDVLTREQYDWLAKVVEQKLKEGQRGLGDRRRPPTRFDEGTDRRRGPRAELIGMTPRPVQHYIAGIAFLRTGQYEDAIEQLQQAERMPWPQPFMVHAPLWIAYRATGQAEKAGEQQRQVERVVSQLSDSESMPNRMADAPWFDLVELQVLYAEACDR
jgi:serine/threonine protein kinase